MQKTCFLSELRCGGEQEEGGFYMAKAKQGDKVRVHYTGKLDDGSIFDSSVNRDPLEFTIGSGNLIPGFEEGVINMSIGEKKSVTISPEQAYGP
jgi:peptidylprolyl isomerase